METGAGEIKKINPALLRGVKTPSHFRRRGQIRTAVKGFADHHLSTRSPDYEIEKETNGRLAAPNQSNQKN